MSILYEPKAKNGDLLKLPQVFHKVLIGNGAWPTEESNASDFLYQFKSKLYNIYGWLVWTNLAYIAICELGFSIDNVKDVITAAESFSTSMIALFLSLRSLYFRLTANKLRDLLKTFAAEIWIDGKKYPRKVQQCHRIMLPVFVYFMSLFVVLIIYGIIPIYVFFNTNQTMDSTNKVIPYPMIFPYDVQKGLYYVLTYLSSIHAGYVIITNFYGHDAIFLLFVSYLCGQFEILHGDIVRLIPECHAEWQQRYGIITGVSDVKSASYGEQPDSERVKLLQDMYSKRLHELSARHNDLFSFCVQLNDLISFPLLMNIINSTLLICFCGFQFLILNYTGTASVSDYMRCSSFFLSVTLQLFMICTSGTMLISYSADTAFYLYRCNWEGGQLSINSPLLLNPEDMDVAKLNAKLPLWKYIKYYPAGKQFCYKLRFMIMRSQRPVELNAMRFTILSLEGFTKILSSSMSYFTLLKTFLDKRG